MAATIPILGKFLFILDPRFTQPRSGRLYALEIREGKRARVMNRIHKNGHIWYSRVREIPYLGGDVRFIFGVNSSSWKGRALCAFPDVKPFPKYPF